MTIRTKAAWTLPEGVCDRGRERTAEALARLGLTEDSMVTMQQILQELGLSDTLYSFCRVKKGDEAEASTVLRRYMNAVANATYRYIIVADPNYAELLKPPMLAIDKRVRGIRRPELWNKRHAAVKALHDAEQRAHIKHWLNALLCLLSSHKDHLCATHASISLMDGADIVGIRKETHTVLYETLSELLGPDDEHP